MNKTQRLALFVWNSWKGKPATAGRFVPAKRKTEATSTVVVKKVETEMPKLKRNTVKLTQADRQDLISSTQHLDACFSTMWRRAV
jgi:hypothetical protein